MNKPNDQLDDDLQAFLAEDSELLRRYRDLPQSEPGKHLDAAILGLANNAVRRRPALRQRWLVPLASAASVVVAAGIGWRVHQSQQQDAARGTQPAAKYDVLEIDLQSGDRRRALDTAVMPPQPAPVDAAGSSESEVKKESKRQTLSEIIAAPSVNQGIVVEPHTRPDHAQAGRAPEQRESMPVMPSAASAPQVSAAAAPVPPPARAEADAERQDQITVSGSRLRRANEADSRQSKSFADARDDEYGDELLSPADWIERIRALVSSRRLTQAREEVARFRAAYPSYRLPPDLRRYER